MAYKLIEFPIERTELNIEITHHPTLIKEMAEVTLCNQGRNDFALMLGVVGAYCEVMIDGQYTEAEINKLCQILTDKLRAKRIGLVIAPADILH